MTYAIGENVCDEYAVRLPLGEGGMGEVYLVEHGSSGELRAAKIMRGGGGASGADMVGFRQEALSLLNVGSHPFVVRLFEVRERGRDIVLIMEYIAPEAGCTTLEDVIRRGQGYNDRLLGAWAVEFCVGMEHALSCGIAAHRDIKPANVLIGSGPFLKISDFGLALAASRYPAFVDGAPKRPSQLQMLEARDGCRTCGTPGYVAPELLAGGKASQQSDIFSFGVMLWQMAARSTESPYGVEYKGNTRDYLDAVLEKALDHAVTHIVSPYTAVIQRCLEPNPADRYPDFPALREAIKSAMKAAKIPAMDFIVNPGFQGSFSDYVNRGRSYLILGRHERAHTILARAVEHDPKSYEAQVACAEASSHRGKLVEAVRAYEAARDLRPEAATPLNGMAFAWLELGEPTKARAALDEVLAQQPENLEALLLLARVEGAQGNDDAALKGVERVIAIDPRDWRAHDYHGRALWSLGKLGDAARAFGTCLRINPLAPDVRLALASVLTAQNELVAAREEYERAIRLFRDNPETLNKIAAHMAEHRHEKGAIDLFRQIADAEPQSRSIMIVNIGNAQRRMGDVRSAVASYRQAIEINPENALAYERLGDVEAESGRHDKAAEYFGRACELEADNPRYHASAGTAYLQAQGHRVAAEHFRRSLALFPEQPSILYNLAVALCCDGQEGAGLEELAKAVRLDEGYARAWYLKAVIEVGLGLEADAMVSADHAVANGSQLSARELQKARSLLGEQSGRGTVRR